MECARCHRKTALQESVQLAHSFCDAGCRDAYSARTKQFLRAPEPHSDSLLVPLRYIGAEQRARLRRLYPLALLTAGSAKPARVYCIVPRIGVQRIGPQTKRTAEDESGKRSRSAADEEDELATVSEAEGAPAADDEQWAEDAQDLVNADAASLARMRIAVAGQMQFPMRYYLVFECMAYAVFAMAFVLHNRDAIGNENFLSLLMQINSFASPFAAAFHIDRNQYAEIIGRAIDEAFERYYDYTIETTDNTLVTQVKTYIDVMHDIVDEAFEVLTAFKDVALLIERVSVLPRLTELMLHVSFYSGKPLTFSITSNLLFDPNLPLRVIHAPSTAYVLKCVGPIDLDDVFEIGNEIGRGKEGVVVSVRMLYPTSSGVSMFGRYALKITLAGSSEPLIYRALQRAAQPQVGVVRMLFSSRWLLMKPLSQYVELPNFQDMLVTVLLLELADRGPLPNLIVSMYDAYEKRHFWDSVQQRRRPRGEVFDVLSATPALRYTLSTTVICMIAQMRMQMARLRQLFREFKIGDLHWRNVLVFSEQRYSALVYVLQRPVPVTLSVIGTVQMNSVHLLVVPLHFTNYSLLKIADMGAATITYRVIDESAVGGELSDTIRGALLHGEWGTSPGEILSYVLLGSEQLTSLTSPIYEPLTKPESQRMREVFPEIFVKLGLEFFAPLLTRVLSTVELDIAQLESQRNREFTAIKGDDEKGREVLERYNAMITARYRQFTEAGSVVRVQHDDELEMYARTKLGDVERLAGLPRGKLQDGRLLWVRMLGEVAEPIARVEEQIRDSPKK
jgi:hypothetical protein